MDQPQQIRTHDAGLGPFRGIAAVIGLACIGLVAGCVVVLFQERADLIVRSNRMAENILVLAEQTVKVEISRYDSRLQDVIVDLEKPNAQPGALPSMDGLFGGEGERQSTGDIMVVNSSGKILESSRPDLSAIYADALPHVLATTRFDAMGLGISGVVKARPGEPEIALVRHVPNTQQDDGWAVVAMLPMSWIQGVFSQIQLGEHGIIGLVDSNHILLARKPLLPNIICTRIWPRQNLDRPISGQIFRSPVKSRIDGIFRRIASTRVGPLPLFVFVGLATQDIFAGWQEAAIVLLVSVTLLTAIIIALTTAVARQFQRKMVTDQRLLELNQQLEELARTDPLTGLLNRRGFDENLAREWRRCRRAAKPISLLMLDADFFKQYNDHYGHQAGDLVLQRLGRCIEENIRRPGDVAARYGGEEFAVVLPDTNIESAMFVAENIVAGLAACGIVHAPERGRVTISVGVGYAEPGGEAAAADLVAAADVALYRSKTSGRNRITARALRAPAEPAQP